MIDLTDEAVVDSTDEAIGKADRTADMIAGLRLKECSKKYFSA